MSIPTRLLFVAILIAMPLSLDAQDKNAETRAAKIKKEIAELRARLAKLEAELIELDGKRASYIGPVKGNGKFSLELGAKGDFGGDKFEVVKIRTVDGAILRPVGSSFEFLAQDILTKGLVDGSIVTMPGQWHVNGTYKEFGRTRFVVVPAGRNSKLEIVK